MNTTDAVDIIAGYMVRSADTLKSAGGVDLVLRALNNAKKFAQRRHNFHMTKVQASVVVNPLPTGGDLSTAVEYGTSTPVAIKQIRKAYGLTNSTLAPPGTGPQFFPLRMATRDTEDLIMRTRINRSTVSLNTRIYPEGITTDPILIQDNNMVYFYPDISTARTLVMSVYKWLPDYGYILRSTITSRTTSKLVDTAATFITRGVKIGNTVTNTISGATALVTAVDSETQLSLNANIFPTSGTLDTYTVATGVETDVFLENCFDFLLYRSISELNFMLKEDQRVQISQGKIEESWTSLLAWDTSIIEEGVEY